MFLIDNLVTKMFHSGVNAKSVTHKKAQLLLTGLFKLVLKLIICSLRTLLLQSQNAFL